MDVAIIGIGLRIAHATNLEEYWSIFEHNLDCIRSLPSNRQEQVKPYTRLYVKEGKPTYFNGNFLERIDEFDNEFFNISPREAQLMDPVHRIFLEVVQETFDNAGYTSEKLAGSRTGVFLGYTSASLKDNYATNILFYHPELMQYAVLGNMAAVLPSRISQLLDLQGPTMLVDTACSSSLVTVHLACESIRNGTSTMAVAGGIKLNTMPLILEALQLGIEANDFHTRTFDNFASGAANGEGIACILLKEFEQARKDGDYIYAKVKGTAINHDGKASGLTAPNASAQARVLQDAWKNAGIIPSDLSYIEVHGTGTNLGDPIEMQGLVKAFTDYTEKKQFCALSAAKSNIGHLNECSGMASMIKVIAALQHKKIPGIRNFNIPNTKINFCGSPFYVNKDTKFWEKQNGIRLAGVSAFGLSGTNCHVVLQEYVPEYNCMSEEQTLQGGLLTFSAKSSYSLHTLASRYYDYLENIPENYLTNIVININKNRTQYPLRAAVYYRYPDELRQILKVLAEKDIKEWINVDQTEVNIEPIKHFIEPNDEMKLWFQKGNKTIRQKAPSIDIFGILAKYYCKGVLIDWELLYSDIAIQKVPLPPYPFQKKRFWLPLEKTALSEDIKLSYDKQNFEDIYYRRIFLNEDINDSYAVKKNSVCLVITDFLDDALIECLNGSFDEIREVFFDETMFDANDVQKTFFALYRKIDFSQVTHIILPALSFGYGGIMCGQLVRMFRILCLYTFVAEEEKRIKVISILQHSISIGNKDKIQLPEDSTIWGLSKSLNREVRSVNHLCIDVDSSLDWNCVVKEIAQDTDKDLVIYRNGKRYIEGLKEDIISTMEPVKLRTKGVYLLSGGTGGIGYEVAKEIAKRASGCTIILFGRSKLPTEECWKGWLNNTDQCKEECEKIQRISDLRQLGCQVEYHTCNVANEREMSEMIKNILSKHRVLNGVIHAAGVGGGRPLQELDTNRLLEVISPKVMGAYLLDVLTRDQKLDFFINFSSIATILSSTNLSDYTAANMFLDSFSNYRANRGNGLSLTVNWATWSDVGMSVKNDFTLDTVFKTLKTEEAIQAFFRTIGGVKSGNIIIGHLNLKNKISLMLNTYPLVLSDKIRNALSLLQQESETEMAQKDLSTMYSKVENKVSAICEKILGYDGIDVRKNFFELGADSILMGIIYKEVDKVYPGLIRVTDLFAYPTVYDLSSRISDQLKEKGTKKVILYDEGKESGDGIYIQKDVERLEAEEKDLIRDSDIAIIGLGFELPNASNLDEYWEILFNGLNAIREIPATRKMDIEKHLRFKGVPEESICFRKCGFLNEINQFDYRYFGMSPRESTLIDPVNRLFLQCCAKAIDDSGYGIDQLRGTNTSIFLGYSANLGNTYSRLLYEMDPNLYNDSLPVNQVSMAASRVAYVFDLKGASMVVDTACSSSLVAIHLACEQIRTGKCSMALAGGASISQTPLLNGFEVGFESSEEKTRAFAEGATGSAIAEGVGVILLKSLKQAMSDGDAIYAVVRGSAMNQDGSSFGIAAPNFQAQADVIQKAWECAGVTGTDISYIEAHGTGTQLGDPIEINGIQEAFSNCTDEKQICGVGSVKTNLGHANEASGISGLLKLILTLQHKEIPPSLNFNMPNLNIDFINSPLYVVDKRRTLPEKQNRTIVGMSGFGMSGTNCHMVLESAPSIKAIENTRGMNNKPLICTFSAVTSNSLEKILPLYNIYVKQHPDLDLRSFCYNVNVGRKHFPYRLAFLFVDYKDLLEKLGYLSKLSYDCINYSWCYTGYHMIVPESKIKRFENELTIQEQKEKNRQVEQILYGDISKNKLDQILKLYVSGASVDWQVLYSGQYKKIHLPSYQFEREYCWYEIPEIIVPEVSNKDVAVIDHIFNHRVWVKEELDSNRRDIENFEVLVIYSGKGTPNLTEALEAEGKTVVAAFSGFEFENCLKDGIYWIQSSQAGYGWLFEQIRNRQIGQIVYAKAYREDDGLLERTYENLDEDYFDFLDMIRALGKAHYKKLKITIIGCYAYSVTGKEKILLPHNSLGINIGKVVEQEYPNFSCSGIDSDLDTDVAILAKGILHNDIEYLSAYRDNIRYIEEYGEAKIEPVTDNRIRKNGVYLVTGGTNGIGLELANYISTQAPCHIILMSRSGFSYAKEYKQEECDSNYSYKVSILSAMKDRGCTVDIYACDVSNHESLRNVLSNVRRCYGRICGVVHSAGVEGSGFIMRTKKEDYLRTFAPKIMGTLNLDFLTREDKTDFFVFCSSSMTESGEAGQGDYVSANTYLDAYTDYRNAQSLATYTVQWVSWRDTGMSKRYGINVDQITKALPTKEAVDAFDLFLRSQPQRLMIGQYIINDKTLNILKHTRVRASKQFQDKIFAIWDKISTSSVKEIDQSSREYAKIHNGKVIFIPKSNATTKVEAVDKLVILTGDVEEKYSEVEKQIGTAYKKILGYEKIDVYSSFFEMGGDSVMLSNMFYLIDKMYPGIIEVADLFEYVTVRSLSEYILSQDIDSTKVCFCSESKNKDNELTQLHKLDAEYLAMSLPQERVYQDYRINKNKIVYNIPFVCDVTLISEEELRKVLKKLIKRHDILRTCFVVHDKKLVQKIVPEIEYEIEKIVMDDCNTINYQEYMTKFQLNECPLFRLKLFVSQSKTLLFFDMHHILMDGFSQSLLQEDLEAIVMKRELPAIQPYKEYVDFEKKYISTEEYRNMEEYWRKKFDGFDYGNPLLASATKQQKKEECLTISRICSKDLKDKIEVYCRDNKITIFSFMLTGIAMTIARLTDKVDIAFAVPVLNRPHANFMKMIGLFINLIPIRLDLTGVNDFEGAIKKMWPSIREDLKFQFYQFNHFIRRNRDKTPAFYLYFNFEDVSLKVMKGLDDYVVENSVSKFDLDINVRYCNEMFRIELTYKDKYASSFIESIIEEYICLIKSVLS
ncbi:SDR family NAD(P)-dependent oxidoreductase [Hungatella hathewayi]|uniref:SDR family NAD(P)-dependent oxidoreductase n=1 Tax=Hungatella hathewayi TaxID=154046 RepID=UPI0035649EBC